MCSSTVIANETAVSFAMLQKCWAATRITAFQRYGTGTLGIRAMNLALTTAELSSLESLPRVDTDIFHPYTHLGITNSKHTVLSYPSAARYFNSFGLVPPPAKTDGVLL